MPRKLADCRDFPSESNCTLTIAGEEEEVVKAATEHAKSVHGHSESKELRDQIRKSLKDESSLSEVGSSESRNFDKPNETRDFKSHGQFKVLNFPDGRTFGKGVFEPGWEWSKDVKPIVGTETCQVHHLGYCTKGEMEIRMDDGKVFTIHKGDVFEIGPGHDARVTGQEACELIDVGGYAGYASAMKKAA